MITQEQRDMVRDWFASSAEALSAEIQKEISAIGGEDMLISRIDLLYWVLSSREEVRLYQEAIRLLDGGSDIDETAIRAALEHRICDYRNTVRRIRSLEQSIREQEAVLQQNADLLPQQRLAVDVLRAALNHYALSKPDVH